MLLAASGPDAGEAQYIHRMMMVPLATSCWLEGNGSNKTQPYWLLDAPGIHGIMEVAQSIGYEFKV